MVARNNITGDKIQSKGVLTKQGEDNWDLIFGKKSRPTFTEQELMSMEVIQDLIDNPKKKETHDILRPDLKWQGDSIQLDWDESRIDTIGQNGNDGEHYDKVEGLDSTSDKPVEPT
jgi:hypothetical protein